MRLFNKQTIRCSAFAVLGLVFAATMSVFGTTEALGETSVDAQRAKVAAEIAEAKAKGCGTGPYEAALTNIDADIAKGSAGEEIAKRLDSLDRSLKGQIAAMAGLKNRKIAPAFSHGSENSTSSDHHAATSDSNDFDINTFVYTVGGAVGVSNVSPGYLAEVKRLINGLPKHVLSHLQQAGCRICVSPRMQDRYPDIRNTQPRGWEQGKTWKNVDGIFNGSEVVVCEYKTNEGDDTVLEKVTRAPYLVRHELGHACDHYFGGITRTEEFRHMYYLELAKMDPNLRDAELAYFAQKSDGGVSECFAELFAIMNGGGASKNIDQNLKPIFPECCKMIHQKLGF